jgi:hypothetical protein
VSDSSVELIDGTNRTTVRRGERFGVWTLMEVVTFAPRFAVLEDFTRKDGRILLVDTDGVQLELPKTLEPTEADPESDTVWLGKAIPRQWLRDGETVSVTNAPTRWGRVSFSIASRAKAGRVDVSVRFPATGLRAETRLRIRADGDAPMKSVTLNGKPWTRFEPASEVVIVPAGTPGAVDIVAWY